MRYATFAALAACLCVAWTDARDEAKDAKPEVVRLWAGAAPDENDPVPPETTRPSPKSDPRQVEITATTTLVTNVSTPTLTVFRPAKGKDVGTAVLVCPGGGYWNLFWQLEGEEVAAWLNSLGVTAFVLKYRVPRRKDDVKNEPARRPLQDAQRAVSLVRSKAKAWGIDPRRIGIMGFSAGGHLAFATATAFDRRTYKADDDVDAVSCRPDFAVSVYSGYLKAKDRDGLSAGLSVPKGTPPVFLAHGGADPISDPEHSVTAYLALKRAGASAELHVYADTTHDFAVRKVGKPCDAWTRGCAEWMKQQGMLGK